METLNNIIIKILNKKNNILLKNKNEKIRIKEILKVFQENCIISINYGNIK
jgi:hypothetical protein